MNATTRPTHELGLKFSRRTFKLQLALPTRQHHWTQEVIDAIQPDTLLVMDPGNPDALTPKYQQKEETCPPALSANDLPDVRGLAEALRNHTTRLSRYIWERLSNASRQELSNADSTNQLLAQHLVPDLNAMISGERVYGKA